MTKFTKSHWNTDEKRIRMDVEFTKVDKQKRLVSGYATLDNVDHEGDIVLAEASARAFARAKGNLREMHDKHSAVGRIVDFKEDTFRAPDGTKYRGIFVTAYVSKGAQSTWEKVLDKTLTGFSIGGSINDFEENFTKDGSQKVRIIKDYDLDELSLVDNPCNQYANVFHIQKSANGSVTVEGMVADTKALNIFYCEEDKIVKEQPDETYQCPVCQEKMKNIGWTEDGPDLDEKVTNIVTKFLNPTFEKTEGGVDVAKENKKFMTFIKSESVVGPGEDESVETGHEAGDPAEVPTPATPAEDAVDVNEVEDEVTDEAPQAVDEVHDEEAEISKKIDELKTVVEKTLGDTRTETKELVETLEKRITDLHESFETKTSEFEKRFKELDENLETTKSKLARFEKNLDNMNSAAAFRKSVDGDESVTETVQKSDTTWNGAFSVDNLR